VLPPLPLSSPSSGEHDDNKAGPKAIKPNNGSAFFAALLKNSLRDWSSSFLFFFSSIIILFYELVLIESVKKCNTYKAQRMAWPLLCTYLRGAPEKNRTPVLL
jgi:hypothetical protein